MDKARFLKVYANLPIKLRKEPILVLDNEIKEPITWNVAYIEVSNETKLGEEIYKKLIALKII